MTKFIVGVVAMIVSAIMLVLWYRVADVINGLITDSMALLIIQFVGWLIAIAILAAGVGLVVAGFRSVAGGKHEDVY